MPRWNLPPHFWTPIGLFAGTLALMLYVNGGLDYRPPITGFARAEQLTVASLESGRLAMVSVQPGQEVSAGQVLARFETAGLDAEAAVLEAEIAQLSAQVTVVGSQARRQQVLDSRQLTQSVDGARVALAKEEAALAEAVARLDALTTERTRVEKLVADKLATADDLTKLTLEYAAVAREVSERPRNIALYKEQLAHTEALQASTPNNYEASLTTSASQALAVARKRLEQLEKRRQRLELVAPAAGQVLSVEHRAGEVVEAGDAILTLVRQVPTQVIACVGEQDALEVHPGMSARLVARDASHAALTGRIIAVGPMVDQLPVRCRRVPSVPSWGREVTLQLEGPQSRLPGEAFDIHFVKDNQRLTPSGPLLPGTSPQTRGVAPDGTAQASPPVNASQPTLLDLSAVDTQRYNLEPSGLTWVAALSRYVVVSDDPGAQEDNKHSPMVFTVGLDGRVDAIPLPVTGTASLNDLESIAPMDGTGNRAAGVYVLASQSLNRKGKRSADRTAFLALVPEGNRLQVVGEAHLAEAIEALSLPERQALGLSSDTRDLNIEGMARWGSALYLGLKAPLGQEQEALIWRLAHPEVLLSTGSLAQAGLSLFARVKLDADIDGRSVPGGISELLFLPDGRLLLTSTPSGTKEGRQSGRLWVTSVPASALDAPDAAAPVTLTPTLVRAFDGLKPEGLSLSPVPGQLVVVFDTGGPAPQWMEMPWPL